MLENVQLSCGVQSPQIIMYSAWLNETLKMTNRIGATPLQQRLPILAAVSSTTASSYAYSFYYCHKPPRIPRNLNKNNDRQKRTIGYATCRRVVLGLGFSFWDQFMGMAGNDANSFFASARQKGQIEQLLKNVEWPEKFPFKDEDFQRFDESPDSLFYKAPRFVTHIDDPAIAALTEYYSKVLPPSNTPGVAILDICSSWVSHYPAGYKQERIVGMGMNEDELKRNPVLTEYTAQDLNVDPRLPFEDNSFDVITNVVSVDYLAKPLDVFKEMRRILKPGGLAIMSFSNRCFWTKAISIWTSTGDADHVMIVGSYFYYAGGFEPPEAVDISPNPGRSDPMYIVYSRKLATA